MTFNYYIPTRSSKKVTGLKYETPKELIPLLYQGNPYNAIETFQTRPIAFNSKQASALYEAMKEHGHKEEYGS